MAAWQVKALLLGGTAAAAVAVVWAYPSTLGLESIINPKSIPKLVLQGLFVFATLAILLDFLLPALGTLGSRRRRRQVAASASPRGEGRVAPPQPSNQAGVQPPQHLAQSSPALAPECVESSLGKKLKEVGAALARYDGIEQARRQRAAAGGDDLTAAPGEELLRWAAAATRDSQRLRAAQAHSLRRDRKREELEQELAEREKQEEQRVRLEAEERWAAQLAAQERRRQLREALPGEPEAHEHGRTLIVLRLPDSCQHRRAWRAMDTVAALYDWV
eukprot:jgi/Mesen1/4040/ME000213S03063